jgi:hypothetical protein
VALLIAAEDLMPLASVRRMMSLADGELRSMDESAVVLPFPDQQSSADGLG